MQHGQAILEWACASFLGSAIIHCARVSESILPSRLVETQPDSFTSARCAKVSDATSTPFFALSAKSFKAEVKGQQDGYTILCPLNESAVQGTTQDTHQSKKQKHAQRQGSDFIVWATSDDRI